MLQDLDKVTFQKILAEKYSTSKNTILTWKKNRANILACYEKGFDSSGMYENINMAPNLQWWIHWLWLWTIDQPKFAHRQMYHSQSSWTDVSLDEDDMKVSEVESLRKPLIEEVRTAIEVLEKFSFYSKFGKWLWSLSEGSTITSIGKNIKREDNQISQIFTGKLIRNLIEKVFYL